MKLGIKQVWSTLFALALISALWVGINFGVALMDYLKKTNYSKAHIQNWVVQSKGDDEHYILAEFAFQADLKEQIARHLFKDKRYRTKEAAMEAIALLAEDEWGAHWYGDYDNPKVSLEKKFPLKQLVNFVVVLFVGIYFRWIKNKLYREAASASR